MRKILVTSALPYANGPIHLGHLVEYIQTDIWVRFQKLRGENCRYFCADDTHGTAIMIRASADGTTPEEVISRMGASHQADFSSMEIEFDHYGSTNTPASRRFCDEIWSRLEGSELIKVEQVEQLYDAELGIFLADRFVRGTCPVCGKADQNGDSCECGATYRPTELKNPVSFYSGSTPEIRSAPHIFVEIERLHDFLTEWTQHGNHLQPEMSNYLSGMFLKEPLYDWDISRPAPYFGFEIPGYPGNYWYVWYDAPIGYIGSTEEWCEKHGEDVYSWWKDPETEIHHFIGKDIIYFHALFWPAMLKVGGFNLPKKVHVHGFLNVNGEKMSKSRGTFIRAATYVKHLDPSYLRYYYASKLTSRVDDLDLNFTDMIGKVNSDLVGNLVNLVSRTSSLIQGVGLSKEYPEDGGFFAAGAREAEEIAQSYESCDFSRVTRIVMQAGNRANQYIEQQAPWKLRKDASKQAELQDVCTVALNLYRQMVIYLSPILPSLARQTADLFNEEVSNWSWEESQRPLVGVPIKPFKHFMKRMTQEQVDAMIEESQEKDMSVKVVSAEAVSSEVEQPAGEEDVFQSGNWEDSGAALENEPLSEECSIEDFQKVDLRIARIIMAEEVADARKLLHLTLSLGGGVTRNVFAGIKSAYKPEELVGRLVVCVANLKPRQMKFGLSEGMVAAAGAGGTEIYLLSPDTGAKPGHRIH